LINKKYRFLFLFLILPLFLFLSPSEESHGGSPLEFMGKVINFLVLFGGLVFLLRKPLKNFLQSRTQTLADKIKETRESRQDAENRLQQTQMRLEKMSEEVGQIRRRAEADGQTVKERILNEAEKESRRLKDFAGQEIEMLTQTGIQEIKKHAADLAIQIARKKIMGRIKEEDQSEIIDKSIKRLEKLYEKSNSGKEIHTRTH